MKKILVRNQWANRPKPNGESFLLSSETVPGQALSVRELLERQKKGMPLTASGAVPIWRGSDDELIHDIKNLDFADQQAIRESYQERLEEIKAELKEQKKAAIEKAKEEARKKEEEIKKQQEARDERARSRQEQEPK